MVSEKAVEIRYIFFGVVQLHLLWPSVLGLVCVFVNRFGASIFTQKTVLG